MDGFNVDYLIVKFPIGCSCLYIAGGDILPETLFTDRLLEGKLLSGFPLRLLLYVSAFVLNLAVA